jgi:hypothetical protein
MTIDLGISVAECMPVILHERWRYGWIAEARVAIGIGRGSHANIMARCLDTIIMALFGSLRIGRRRRWRWIVGGWLRMRTSCDSERNE